MRWTIAGCCGFVLISLSVALQISQKPRFYGLRPGVNVPVYCTFSDPTPKIPVKWFKAEHFDANREEIGQNERIRFWKRSMVENALLNIKAITLEDGGVYFCSMNGTWGPGTEIQVARPFDLTKAQYRTQMKDGLIVLQGLLLAVCIAAFLFRKQKLVKDNDSLYEEPETDHIYEGLAIETCGEGLYEDLTAYARAEGAEAPWE